MTTRRHFRAGHLPGLDPASLRWQVLPFEAHGARADIEVPVLDQAQMTQLARHVRRAAREVLQPLPVDALIGIIDRAVARLLDPADPARRELDALLPVVSGFDAEMVRLGLNAYLQTFRAPQLQRFVAQDFSNPKVLDGFQPALKGGAVRAFGPQLLVHGWAGNVPGLPLWSLACGLLVKAGNIGKLPSAEPVFASVVARVLGEVHPPLADALAIVWWKGGESPLAGALYREADTVLAYGGNAALREVREQVPATTRFLGYGHKLGVALVGRAALDMQPVSAATVFVTASTNGGSKKARATSNIDMNSPQALDNEVENSGQAAGVELEVPLDQLPPLERLREAKRRARAADASGHQEPLS